MPLNGVVQVSNMEELWISPDLVWSSSLKPGKLYSFVNDNLPTSFKLEKKYVFSP